MLKQSKLNEVLEYINRYLDENGFPPTVRDMCRDLGIKSTATAYDYLNRLKEQGHLEKTDKKKRAVVPRGGSSLRAPLLGTVNAGTPILPLEENEGYFPLPSAQFGSGEVFLLNVQGDSMIEAGILNGDKIVVRRQQTADDGDIVVAMFDDGISDGATVKRLRHDGDTVILHPENAALDDIIPEHQESIVILGKVVGLLRNL